MMVSHDRSPQAAHTRDFPGLGQSHARLPGPSRLFSPCDVSGEPVSDRLLELESSYFPNG